MKYSGKTDGVKIQAEVVVLIFRKNTGKRKRSPILRIGIEGKTRQNAENKQTFDLTQEN